MSVRDDGGPAFPKPHDPYPSLQGTERPGPSGMSLRDYFAAHCDQPGQQEIAAAAGVVLQETCGLPFADAERQKLQTFAQWYAGLPVSERFRLYAVVRYQMADAMLKERGEGNR